MTDYPLVKRFFELFQADPRFRELYSQDPEAVLSNCGLPLDPQYLAQILAIEPSHELKSEHPALVQFRQRSEKACAWMRRWRAQPARNEKFTRWRQRQLRRIQALLHVSIFDKLVATPIAFELSKGCSGTCPFCCFDPSPLGDVVRYTPGTARLWGDLLRISNEILAPIMGETGICYHATEPFDTPDYELFVQDFHRIAGLWPQLTTIKHVHDPERLRRYLHMVAAENLERPLVRLSVCSLRMLWQLHREFSPQELRLVDVIPNNPESNWLYSPAGRARKLANRYQKRGEDRSWKFYQPGPVACVSGFVVNLVDHSIRLLSTCTPDDLHPFGYIEFDAATFEDAKDYERQLNLLIKRNMGETPGEEAVLSFNPALSLTRADREVTFSTRFLRRRIRGDESFLSMVDLIAEGQYTWADIRRHFDNPWLLEVYLKEKLATLFDLGLLDEERWSKGRTHGAEATSR